MLLNRPFTAHILGGAPIGATPADGVLDGWHRVWTEPGLHVVDGAAVSANLGANPSLTIAAQAERACRSGPIEASPIHGPRWAQPTSGGAGSAAARRRGAFVSTRAQTLQTVRSSS